MWKLAPSPEYLRRVNGWPNKYHRELVAVHDNLDTFLRGLNAGLAFGRMRSFGFVHDEGNDLLALEQNAGGGFERQTRLYVFLDDKRRLIDVITLGDTGTQPDDVRFARERVESLRLEQAQHHEQKEHVR
jgi:hypothetical protein